MRDLLGVMFKKIRLLSRADGLSRHARADYRRTYASSNYPVNSPAGSWGPDGAEPSRQPAAGSLRCHCRFQAYPDTWVFSRLLPSDHLHTAFAVGYWNGKFTLIFVVSRENDWCWLDTELLTSPEDAGPVSFASPGTSSNNIQKSPSYSPFRRVRRIAKSDF